MNTHNRTTIKRLPFFCLGFLFILTSVAIAKAQEADNLLQPTEGLSDRQKAIIPIAAFTASGDISALHGALNDGLDAGLTINEIKEILIHTYAYAGFPRALNGINAFIVVLEEREQKGIRDLTGNAATPMPIDLDKNSFGHQVRNRLVGRDLSKRTSGYAVFTPVIDQFLVEHLFADIFYRDVLSFQDRELVTISILSTMPGTDGQLRPHLSISMREGLRQNQLQGFVTVLEQKIGLQPAQRARSILYSLLGIQPAQDLEKSVLVTRKAAPSTVSSEHFTGHVTVESWFASDPANSYRGAVVNFDTGARTAWHTHPNGQTLLVISGRGQVQSEGEPIQGILPGDVVWIPADERHWHGAAPDSPMSHVAISTPLEGQSVEWMEKVSDAEFFPKQTPESAVKLQPAL